MSLSRQLAETIKSVRFEDLPPEVVEFAKYCVLDWLGSALAGEKQAPIRMIRRVVEDMGGAPQASLIGGGKSSAVNAALLNGAASHAVELDDVHKSSIIHAATVVIPAALAVAEWRGRSGRDLITAIVLGYDVCYRIGEAVTPSHYFYWHNTATCGTFGAAAAAARLLDLPVDAIAHALGSAGTQAAGLWEFIENGSMSKQLHTGKAAMNGVISALLAEQGFTGADKILEGRRGFFRAMSESFDETRVTDGLGERFKIRETSFKIHASCRHTHPAIDVMLDIQKEAGLKPEDVRRIDVKTYKTALDITDNPNPQTVYEGKFSLQFCTALAFVKKRAGLADFNEEALRDGVIRGVMDKVRVSVDPAIDEAYPEKWGAFIEVELTDGRRLSARTDYPKGDPEAPVTGELVDKFRLLAAGHPEERVERYIVRTMELDRLPLAGLLLGD